jgi:hypothetical protein
VTETRNYFNNTKVANHIIKFNDLNRDFAISEFGKQDDDVCSYITFAANDQQSLQCTLTRFDLAIMDTVYTLLRRGRECFTLEMVADTLFGKEVKYRKDATSKLDKIFESIEKLASIRIRIDYTSVMKAKNPKTKGKLIIIGSLLPVTCYWKVSNVKERDKIAYRIDRKPVLYEYAEQLGRIISVPSNVFSIYGAREDIEFALVKQELIKEIELMKNDRNKYLSTDIVYEWEHGERHGGFIERLGIDKNKYKTDVQWRKRKSRLNEQIGIILDHLVDIDYIKGHKFKKSGRAITGVSIIL